MLTLLLLSLVASVSAYGKGGPLLGGLVDGGVITNGPLLGGGGIIGGSGGILNGGGLLLNNVGLGGLIGGINTGRVVGGQPWCTCSLKCAPGQIKLNKNCNLAPLLPGSLNTCCSVLPWWVTSQNYGASIRGAGIIGGGGIIGGVGGNSGLLGPIGVIGGPIGGIGGPIGGVVAGPVSVVSGVSNVVGGYRSTGKGYY